MQLDLNEIKINDDVVKTFKFSKVFLIFILYFFGVIKFVLVSKSLVRESW